MWLIKCTPIGKSWSLQPTDQPTNQQELPSKFVHFCGSLSELRVQLVLWIYNLSIVQGTRRNGCMGWTCRSQNWLTLDPYYLDHHTSLHPRVHAILKLEYRDTCNIGLQRTSILSYLRTSELNHLLLQFFFVPMTNLKRFLHYQLLTCRWICWWLLFKVKLMTAWLDTKELHDFVNSEYKELRD